MSMADAFWLANHIQAHVPSVRVMAVGMFLRVEDIRDDSPWKVLVTAAGLAKPRVLLCEAELGPFVELVQRMQVETPEGMLF